MKKGGKCIIIVKKGAYRVKSQVKGNIMLFICALVWGIAFVAQSEGMKHVGAFTFLCPKP